MSAFIVDRELINYLIEAALCRGIGRPFGGSAFAWYLMDSEERHELTPFNADETGQMLWDENIYSVAYRYDSQDVNPAKLPGVVGEDYLFRHQLILHHIFAPVEVLKACDCYEYQSCEHNGWYKSQAHAFIDRLRRAAISALPGYDEAEWGAPTRTKRQTVTA